MNSFWEKNHKLYSEHINGEIIIRYSGVDAKEEVVYECGSSEREYKMEIEIRGAPAHRWHLEPVNWMEFHKSLQTTLTCCQQTTSQ